MSSDQRVDYEELEGEPVKVITSGEATYMCRVAGCHRDIGITLVDIITKEKVICLNGRKRGDMFSKSDFGYDKTFDYIVKKIKKGKFVMSKLHLKANVEPVNTYISTCGFE